MTGPRWTWYGHAAHFIGSANCRFHLATKVGKFLISTVGEYLPTEEMRRARPLVFETIGLDRTYETMVFPIGKGSCECGCGLPDVADWSSSDFDGYNDAKAASRGHLRLCRKFAKKQAAEADQTRKRA